jgi:hypothetical protein
MNEIFDLLFQPLLRLGCVEVLHDTESTRGKRGVLLATYTYFTWKTFPGGLK